LHAVVSETVNLLGGSSPASVILLIKACALLSSWLAIAVCEHSGYNWRDRPDHPTAEEVFLRAKETRPEISLATVYNCLDALVRCGLVKQVNVDRSATRYCPNMQEHTHFFCEGCGRISDLDYTAAEALGGVQLPRGFKATHWELSVRGLCRDCISRQTG